MKNYAFKDSNKGITLIALIITIIVMLIIIAVTIKTVIQSGLFGHAEKAINGYSMHEARVKLGTTPTGAMAEKYTNKNYNENDYLDKYIQDNLPGSKVVDNVVILDGWAFELDRNTPKIGQDLGQEGKFTYPELNIEKGILLEDKLSIPVIITASETEYGISKIEVYLNGKLVKEFDDCNGSKEEITRTFTATENGTYFVRVYSEINITGYVNVDEIILPKLKIGDYVSYTPNIASDYLIEAKYSGHTSNQTIPQDTTLKWQIMNINDDGTIQLIAEKSTALTVYFGGALGYNNGVLLLNDLCKSQYSNVSLGIVSRSLNLADIEKQFNELGTTKRDECIVNTLQYGKQKTYGAGVAHTSNIYKNHDKNVTIKPNNIAQRESENYYSEPTTLTSTQENSLTITQTYYKFESQTNYYNDSNFHKLIFDTGTTYWLASRFTSDSVSVVAFGLRCIMNTNSRFLWYNTIWF